jgi:hypothetical protein
VVVCVKRRPSTACTRARLRFWLGLQLPIDTRVMIFQRWAPPACACYLQPSSSNGRRRRPFFGPYFGLKKGSTTSQAQDNRMS